MLTTDDLLRHTSAALPDFQPNGVQPIEKGGSSRRFFRVTQSNGDSVILVQDLGEKEENSHYATVARFLNTQGVPVPRVLAEKHSLRLLWLEDMGEQDLWASRNEPWDIRRPLYESVLRGAALLHRIRPESAAENGLKLQPGFDERLYRWEQEYFAKYCLGELFGISDSKRTALLRGEGLSHLASNLAAHPPQLVHRDFQSQNIMIRDGSAWFIDFQGMRPGLMHYDLASLLCDPYVTIPTGERSSLLSFYHQLLAEDSARDRENFERLFWQAAVQRLMQALGAYGFLSIHKGKHAFRAHVAPALERLREAMGQLPSDDRLDELAALLENLKASSTVEV